MKKTLAPETITRNALINQFSRIDGWLSIHEGELLFELAKLVSVPGEIVEVGSWKGRSTVCLAYGTLVSGHPKKVIAIDPHIGELEHGKKKLPSTYKDFLRNMKEAGIEAIVKPVKATSVSAAKLWKGKPISVLFIDGLHDYDHAKEDYLLWHKAVVDGGVVAFHDGFCGIEGVLRAINETVLPSGNYVDFGTVSSIFYAVKGKPSLMDTLKVTIKKGLIRLSHWIYLQSVIPKIVKTILIHRLIRLLLLTPYTAAVYQET